MRHKPCLLNQFVFIGTYNVNISAHSCVGPVFDPDRISWVNVREMKTCRCKLILIHIQNERIIQVHTTKINGICFCFWSEQAKKEQQKESCCADLSKNRFPVHGW